MDQFCSSQRNDPRLWDYLMGDVHFGRSIGVERMYHLQELSILNDGNLTIALHNHATDAFTKWRPLSGHKENEDAISIWDPYILQTAPDIHRSVIECEIVIESDNPTYEENAEATHLIGSILERKGFIPHYYFSGGKSIHIHVYFDWKCLRDMDQFMQKRVMDNHLTANVFKKKFMEWLRTTMISCWGLKARVFDNQLVSAKHLIRCELSRNKKGCKTFLGYTHKDIPPFPIYANEETGIFPELGEIRLSRPPNIQEIIEEYLYGAEIIKRKTISKRKEQSLSFFTNPDKEGELKGCAAFMFSDEFSTAKDGFKRAAYFLTNELRRVYGPKAEHMILNWNARMGDRLREQELTTRFLSEKVYFISHDDIHDLLKEAGFPDPDALCKSTGRTGQPPKKDL